MAACSIIVTEAGGSFTDLDGRPGPLGTGGSPPTAGCTMPCWLSSPSRTTTPMIIMMIEASVILPALTPNTRTRRPHCRRSAGRRRRASRRRTEGAAGRSPMARPGWFARSWCCATAAATPSSSCSAARPHVPATSWPAPLLRRPGHHLGRRPGLAAGHGQFPAQRAACRAATPWRAVLVHLVDLPDVTAEVVRRMIRQSAPGTRRWPVPPTTAGLATRCCIGRDHLESIMVSLTGDSGAKGYLAHHGAHSVECGDLAGGQDHDT